MDDDELDNAPDNALALAASRGERAAFVCLLERHYDRIHALAFRLTGNSADADDITQDVCTDLPARLDGYRGNARFTTWLYRVTVNATNDRRRRYQTQQKAAAGWGERETARRLELVELRARRQWLEEAMQLLGEDLADTLALVLAGLTHAEAADILDIAEGTVSWRIAEARRQLQGLDEEHGT